MSDHQDQPGTIDTSRLAELLTTVQTEKANLYPGKIAARLLEIRGEISALLALESVENGNGEVETTRADIIARLSTVLEKLADTCLDHSSGDDDLLLEFHEVLESILGLVKNGKLSPQVILNVLAEETISPPPPAEIDPEEPVSFETLSVDEIRKSIEPEIQEIQTLITDNIQTYNPEGVTAMRDISAKAIDYPRLATLEGKNDRDLVLFGHCEYLLRTEWQSNTKGLAQSLSKILALAKRFNLDPNRLNKIAHVLSQEKAVNTFSVPPAKKRTQTVAFQQFHPYIEVARILWADPQNADNLTLAHDLLLKAIHSKDQGSYPHRSMVILKTIMKKVGHPLANKNKIDQTSKARQDAWFWLRKGKEAYATAEPAGPPPIDLLEAELNLHFVSRAYPKCIQLAGEIIDNRRIKKKKGARAYLAKSLLHVRDPRLDGVNYSEIARNIFRIASIKPSLNDQNPLPASLNSAELDNIGRNLINLIKSKFDHDFTHPEEIAFAAESCFRQLIENHHFLARFNPDRFNVSSLVETLTHQLIAITLYIRDTNLGQETIVPINDLKRQGTGIIDETKSLEAFVDPSVMTNFTRAHTAFQRILKKMDELMGQRED